MTRLTLAPDDLAFDVEHWREITRAANAYLHKGQPFDLSEAAIDELYDIGTTLTNDHGERLPQAVESETP